MLKKCLNPLDKFTIIEKFNFLYKKYNGTINYHLNEKFMNKRFVNLNCNSVDSVSLCSLTY